jgi:hypothetical protein
MERKLFSAATEIMAALVIRIFLLQIGWSRLIRNSRIRGSPLTPEGGNSVSENQKNTS